MVKPNPGGARYPAFDQVAVDKFNAAFDAASRVHPPCGRADGRDA
jgi:hypothetical protein